MCGVSDWTSLDHLKQKKDFGGFVVCNKCGFVTYLISDNKELVDMYKSHKHNKKRSFSGSSDDKTKANKLSYHRKMIGDLLRKKKNMSILDFGCSTGYVLKMCRDEFGHKDVTGVELNGAHASYGRGEFGIDIHECATMGELAKDTNNKKYDLIILFAVLEHLLDPVEKMKTFKNYLKPGGQMYVMVPLWFDGLLDSEKNCTNFEHLFIPHHINCFSRRHIDNTFKLSGFNVSKFCNTMYGNMFILDQCEPSKDIILDDSKKIREEISRIKKALEFMHQEKFDESLEAYPLNPEAWIAKGLKVYKSDFNNQLKCFEEALKVDASHVKAVIHIAELFMQNNQYKESIEFHKRAIDLSPNSYVSYLTIAEIYNIQGDFKTSIEWCKKLMEVNPNISGMQFHKGGNTIRDLLGLNYARIWEDNNG